MTTTRCRCCLYHLCVCLRSHYFLYYRMWYCRCYCREVFIGWHCWYWLSIITDWNNICLVGFLFKCLCFVNNNGWSRILRLITQCFRFRCSFILRGFSVVLRGRLGCVYRCLLCGCVARLCVFPWCCRGGSVVEILWDMTWPAFSIVDLLNTTEILNRCIYTSYYFTQHVELSITYISIAWYIFVVKIIYVNDIYLRIECLTINSQNYKSLVYRSFHPLFSPLC